MPKYFPDAASQEHVGNGQQTAVELPNAWVKMCQD